MWTTRVNPDGPSRSAGASCIRITTPPVVVIHLSVTFLGSPLPKPVALFVLRCRLNLGGPAAHKVLPQF
jgi:hypothetical protein